MALRPMYSPGQVVICFAFSFSDKFRISWRREKIHSVTVSESRIVYQMGSSEGRVVDESRIASDFLEFKQKSVAFLARYYQDGASYIQGLKENG